MTAPAGEPYRPDLSFAGKLRRRLVRLRSRRPAPSGPARPWVSFTFDDVAETAATRGAAILERHGMRATFYACAGLAGTAGHAGRYADAGQVCAAAARGHEIGCHTFSHRDLGRACAAATDDELDRSARAFAAWGLPPAATFAYPYGDVSAASKAAVAPRCGLCRAVHRGRVDKGVDLAQAPAVSMDGDRGGPGGVALLEAVAKGGGWLVFYGHEVAAGAGEFVTHPDTLEGLAAAARRLGVEAVTVAEGARRLLAGAREVARG